MCREHCYYSKTASLTLRHSLPDLSSQTHTPTYICFFLLIWIALDFWFCFSGPGMLTSALLFDPWPWDFWPVNTLGGRDKLIEALLVNCIREKPTNSSPQSWPLLPFDPFLPQDFCWWSHLWFSYTFHICYIIIQHQTLLIKSMLCFKWKLED